MPTRKRPRKGSLQFWPRKRVNKFLPNVNWDAINSGKNLKGFICYKAGMVSGYVKDNTEHSMTKDKKIIIPLTILECPPLKIFSVLKRFYFLCYTAWFFYFIVPMCYIYIIIL